MNAIRQMVKIPKDHEIKVRVPSNIPNNETVEMILIFKKKSDTFKQRIIVLKKSIRDNLFLDDIKSISEDFNTDGTYFLQILTQ